MLCDRPMQRFARFDIGVEEPTGPLTCVRPMVLL